MAARNRPRAGPLKDDLADAHEERSMWNQIVNDLKRLKTIQIRATEVSNLIVEMEGKMAERRSLVEAFLLSIMFSPRSPFKRLGQPCFHPHGDKTGLVDSSHTDACSFVMDIRADDVDQRLLWLR